MDQKGIVAHITGWMKDYAQKAGVKGFVVGVSGGIDSAVTASIAARTGLEVLCLELAIHQPKDQVSRAWELIRKLEAEFDNVRSLSKDLTPIFEAFVSNTDTNDSEIQQLSLANVRARIRMTTLYHYAQINGYLVAGTGNKVEDFGVGFFTKYGDGGVDLSPIADLVKTEVFDLGKFLSVPDSIQQAPPTDGLWQDGRSDEEHIGATYAELEWAMEQKEKGLKAEDFKDRQKEVFNIYQRLNTANHHKMIPIPICKIPDFMR